MGTKTKKVATKRTTTDVLKHDPQNFRLHTPRNKDLIRQSLEEIGGGRSILVDGENIVRAGNGVLEQAELLGMKVRVVDAAPDELIAVRRPDLVGDKARRAALYDNRPGQTSEWDYGMLSATLESEKDLLDGIFNANELATLAHSETVALEQVERIASNHYIVVECESEEHQLELLERFVQEGLTCRAAI